MARERRASMFAAKKALDKGKSAEENLLEEAMEAAEVRSAGEKEHAEVRHAARREWIERALLSSKRLLSKRAEEHRGRTASDLQVQAVKDKVNRQSALETLTATYQGLHAELARQGKNLVALQRKANGAMRGYVRFQKLLKPESGAKFEVGDADSSGQTPQFLERVRDSVAKGEKKLEAFKSDGLARVLSFFPWWLLLVLGLGGALVLSNFWEADAAVWGPAGGVAGATVLLILVLQFAAGKGAEPAARAVAEQIEKARRAQVACGERIAARFQEEQEQLATEEGKADNRWEVADGAAKKMREEGATRVQDKHQRALAKNAEMLESIVGPLNLTHEGRVRELKQGCAERIAKLQSEHDTAMAELESKNQVAREEMEAEWNGRVQPIYAEAAAIADTLQPLSPPWERSYLDRWQPSSQLHDMARFGSLSVAGDVLAEEKGLTLPGAKELVIPMALQLPHEGSILFETNGSGRETAVGALNNIMLRLLATTPPGKLSFTIIDPVGLGENFAGIMHLADYEDSVINGRIWTQRGQIEEKLAELNEHIEKVIQMYLRNEYETITEYNEQAGNIAEKYHFLVIADFPSNFSETAANRLQSIVMSGARCGIYTLIHWDHQQTGGALEFVPDTLRDNSIRIRCEDGLFLVGSSEEDGMAIEFDPAPAPEVAIEFIQKIGKSSIDSNRVEVPFEHVIPEEGDFWSSETTKE